MATRLNHLNNSFQEIRATGKPAVLATIIETMGSTYQKAGARSLITETGESMGLLSGGCFEADLREQAESVFSDGVAKTVFYDMRAPDDAIWGLGLGCNGAVRIFMQLITGAEDYFPLGRIKSLVNDNHVAIMATVCESAHPQWPAGHALFINPEAGAQQPSLPETFISKARQTWLEQQPQWHNAIIDNQAVKVFYDIIMPPPELLIIGAGPDAVPVAAFANALGWRVTIVDHRPAYLKADQFPAATLIHCHPQELEARVSPNAYAASVLMTHSIDYDERFLRVIAGSNIPYIGLLGPTKRRDRLLECLGDLAASTRDRIFGPVGLDLGAQTPEEIALSIVAEIQAVTRHRDAGHLSEQEHPIQARATPN